MNPRIWVAAGAVALVGLFGVSAQAADVPVWISWGDGTSSPGSVQWLVGGGGLFQVLGAHTYAQAGDYPVNFVVYDSAHCTRE